MSKALSPEMLASLISYREARASGKSIEAPLARFLSHLPNQRASKIAECDSGIARTAGLWNWQPSYNRLERFLGKRTDADLLAAVPALDHLFIFHRNGFLREKALDQIQGPIESPFQIAALAWRLNDWVPDVRAAAFRCAERCLPLTSPAVFASCYLATIGVRFTWMRWSDREKAIIEKQLARIDVVEAIVNCLLTEQVGPVPSSLAYTIRHKWIDPYLSAIAFKAAVPGVRAIALRALIDGKATFADGKVWRWIDKPMGIRKIEPRICVRPLTIETDRMPLIRTAIDDSSAVVRRVALTGLIDHEIDNPEAAVLAKQCIRDPSASIRARANFILQRSNSDQ